MSVEYFIDTSNFVCQLEEDMQHGQRVQQLTIENPFVERR